MIDVRHVSPYVILPLISFAIPVLSAKKEGNSVANYLTLVSPPNLFWWQIPQQNRLCIAMLNVISIRPAIVNLGDVAYLFNLTIFLSLYVIIANKDYSSLLCCVSTFLYDCDHIYGTLIDGKLYYFETEYCCVSYFLQWSWHIYWIFWV